MSRTTRVDKYGDSLIRAAFSRTLQGRARYLQWLYLKNPGRALQALLNRAKADPDVRAIAEELNERGIHIADARTMLSPQGVAALAESSALIFDKIRAEADEISAILDQGKNADLNKSYMIHMIPPGAEIDADSPFLQLALDPKLLDIMASYFKMWPKLHHIGSWLNFPTPQEASHSQLWHRDPEDYKFLKVFIYLEDVGEKNGPFSFIPKTHPFGADSDIMPRHEHHRRIMDDEMAAAIPRERWLKCTGPANTMVIADTVGFHRGGKVDEGRRLLITFTYTSGTPRKARELRITGNPAWATLPIQKSAL